MEICPLVFIGIGGIDVGFQIDGVSDEECCYFLRFDVSRLNAYFFIELLVGGFFEH